MSLQSLQVHTATLTAKPKRTQENTHTGEHTQEHTAANTQEHTQPHTHRSTHTATQESTHTPASASSLPAAECWCGSAPPSHGAASAPFRSGGCIPFGLFRWRTWRHASCPPTWPQTPHSSTPGSSQEYECVYVCAFIYWCVCVCLCVCVCVRASNTSLAKTPHSWTNLRE